jgi:hypothetical protein
MILIIIKYSELNMVINIIAYKLLQIFNLIKLFNLLSINFNN